MADGLRVRRERPETTEVARTVRREVAWRAEGVVGGERVDARGANDATGAAVMARKAMKMDFMVPFFWFLFFCLALACYL